MFTHQTRIGIQRLVRPTPRTQGDLKRWHMLPTRQQRKFIPTVDAKLVTRVFGPISRAEETAANTQYYQLTTNPQILTYYPQLTTKQKGSSSYESKKEHAKAD